MRLVENEMPPDGKRVFAYTEDGSTYLAYYDRFLTWKGYKKCWINWLSKGRFKVPKKVIGWNNIPTREDTI